MKIALFPGTFDPITLGHIDIINRGLELFDKIYIGIGTNSSKTPMFSIEQRIAWLKTIYINNPKVEVMSYSGLTIQCCKEIGATFILRGIRYTIDFEYEKGIADMNRILAEGIDTVFLTSSPQYATVSSTLVRDVLRNNGNANVFLPKEVFNSFTN